MANTSANTGPPVSANVLKAQAFYSLSSDLRDGEWVPALYFPSSAVLVKFSHKPLILDSPSCFITVAMLSIRYLLHFGNFTVVLKKRSNGRFPKDWIKFTLIFFVYPINICHFLLTSACAAQIILYTIFQ